MAKPYRKQPDDRVQNDLTKPGMGAQIRASLMEKNRALEVLSSGDDALVPAVGAAPVNEAYVTIGNTSGLSAERALTGTANRITVTDAGANSTVTLSAPQDLHTAATFQVAVLGVGVAPTLGLIHVQGTGAISPLTLATSIATSGPFITFRDTDTGNMKLLIANAITGSTSLALPDGGAMSGSDFLVARTSLDTLTQKTIATDGILKSNTSSAGVSFSDNTSASKRLRIILSGATGNNAFDVQTSAARIYTLPNYTGFVAVPPDEGTSGNVLTSTGTGSQPTYQTLSGAGIAPSNAQYVTLALSAGLSAERTLVGTANQITITDSGANANVTLSTPQNLHTSATFQVSTLGLGAVARTSPATLALDVTGRTAFVTVVQSFINNQSNYDIGNSTVLRLTNTSGTNQIRGFTNGVDGRVVLVINDGTNNILFPHQSASATAANRFITSTGQSITLTAGDMKLFVYDGTQSRWRVADWMVPNGQYIITGSYEWDATLIINRDSSGELLIEGNAPGTAPLFKLQDSGTGNVMSVRAPAIGGTRSVDFADFTGQMPIAGVTVVAGGAAVAAGSLGKHDSTANAATVAATTLGKTVSAGFYRLTWYVKVTTAGDIVATDNLTIAAGWNDGGAQTQNLEPENEATLFTALPVDVLNKAYSGSKVVYAAASTDITITATLVNGGATNPQFTFRARLEAIA